VTSVVVNDLKEVRDGEDTIAPAGAGRDARALPENSQIIPDPKISDCRRAIETHSLPSLALR